MDILAFGQEQANHSAATGGAMNNDIKPGRGSTLEQRAMGTEGRRQQVAAAKAFAAEHFIRDIPDGEAL